MTAAAGSTGKRTAVTDLLELSDERDQWWQRVLIAYREGYANGARDQWVEGYVAAIEDVKRIQHDAVDPRLEARRWDLRGEQRTRRTFAQPHPDELQGREGAV
jgi:hypothetical protein